MNKSDKFSAAWKYQAALLSLALCFACPHAFAQEGTADPAPNTETKATPKVYVDPGSVAGGDLGDNDTVKVSSHCVATIKDPPVSDDDMDVSGPTWSWSGSGSFLDDGTPDPDPTASGSAVIAFADAANPSTDYSVTFDAPGDYVDILTATATYTETLKTGKDSGKVITVSYSNIPEDDGTNDGNPGKPDPDFAIITPSAAPSASSSASNPHGAPAGSGAPPAPKPAPKIAEIPGGGKSLYISSSLGTTYYKGGDGSRQQNANGVNPLRMDTLGSLTSKTITYYGHVHGHWGARSPYTWTSGVQVGSGYFKPDPINPQPVNYTSASFGSKASVALHITDSKGGKAVPDAVGDVYFHKPIKLFTGKDKQFPLPDVPTSQSHKDWKILTTHSNPHDSAESDDLEYTLGTTYDYKASFGAEGTLKVDAKIFAAEFKATVGFDITKTITRGENWLEARVPSP